MPKKPPKQLELFAKTWTGSEYEIHALGLLGWRDPLWIRKIEITMLDGQKLLMSLLSIRKLHRIAESRQASDHSSRTVSGAEKS